MKISRDSEVWHKNAPQTAPVTTYVCMCVIRLPVDDTGKKLLHSRSLDIYFRGIKVRIKLSSTSVLVSCTGSTNIGTTLSTTVEHSESVHYRRGRRRKTISNPPAINLSTLVRQSRVKSWLLITTDTDFMTEHVEWSPVPRRLSIMLRNSAIEFVMHVRFSSLGTSSPREIMSIVDFINGSPAGRERLTSKGVSCKIPSMLTLETWTESSSVLTVREYATVDFRGALHT